MNSINTHQKIFNININKYILLIIVFSLVSCVASNKIEIFLKNKKSLDITVSNIQVLNHQIIITGTNLNAVNGFQITEGSNKAALEIESKSPTSIVANTVGNVTFSAGKIFDFVFSSAQAASTFTVNFSLCDSTLGGKGFNCAITPNDKEVLSYDAVSGKWKPRAVNGLSYQGAWDASASLPSTAISGDYFIVSVASGIYHVGDWIVFNGTSYDRIDNSQTITNIFGRTGAITAVKGDYVLDKLGDVDLTTSPPNNGDVLKFNGVKWVPGIVSAGGGGTITGVSGTAPIISSGGTAPIISISQATTSSAGYISPTDWNTFNNKQAAISAGSNSQYYRGDKTWQNLDSSVVLENTNLYFTNARTLGVTLAGFSANNSAITTSDTLLSAMGKAQGQINNLSTIGSNYLIKNGTDTITGVVNINTIGALNIGYTPTNLTDATSKSYVDSQRDSRVDKSGDTMTGDLQLNSKIKLKDSGTNTVSIQAPTTISTSYVLKLPTAQGAANQVLTTDASGNLSWTTPTNSGGTVTGVTGTAPIISSGGTAPVISIAQANSSTNGYLSSADWTTFNSKEPAITAGTTSQYLKGNKTLGTFATDVLATILAGLSTATNSVITASDSLLIAIGKLQAQISSATTTIGNKADLTNASQSITASNINVTTINGGIIPDLSKAVTNEGGAASIQIGSLASRPAAAAGNTGRMYVANDSGNEAVYVSTGSAWIKIASNGLSGTLDDTTAAGGTIVKRAPSGEVYGQYIVPVSTATENTACSLPSGTIAKDSSGNILTCQ